MAVAEDAVAGDGCEAVEAQAVRVVGFVPRSTGTRRSASPSRGQVPTMSFSAARTDPGETVPRQETSSAGEWCGEDPSTDESASSIDADFEIDDAAAARSGDRRALWRVVARLSRRTQRRARRQRRSDVETALRANRQVVWRQQAEVSSRTSGPPPPVCPVVAAQGADGVPDAVSGGHRGPPRKKRFLSAEGTASVTNATVVSTPTPPATRISAPTPPAAAAVVVFKHRSEPLSVGTAQHHHPRREESRIPLAVVSVPSAVDNTDIHAGRRRLEKASSDATAFPVVSLRSSSPPPPMRMYCSVRHSWRRTHAPPPSRAVPHLGSTEDTMAARTTLTRKGPSVAVDSDDSDASGTCDESRAAGFFSLSRRSSRARARLAASVVVAEFGSGKRVLHILRRVLHVSRPSLLAMLEVVQRRAVLSRAAMTQREAWGRREAEMAKYLGGGRLAAVFASGTLPEQRLRSWPQGLLDVRDDIPSSPPGLSTAPWGDAKMAATTAGSDAAAAGLSTGECAWVSQQAAHVAKELAPAISFNRDVAAVREMLMVARLPDGGQRAAALPVLGTALNPVGVRASSPAMSFQGSHRTIVPLPMDVSVFSRDTFDKLLCRVCLVFSCSRHGLVLAEGGGASRWPPPVASPPDPRRVSSRPNSRGACRDCHVEGDATGASAAGAGGSAVVARGSVAGAEGSAAGVRRAAAGEGGSAVRFPGSVSGSGALTAGVQRATAGVRGAALGAGCSWSAVDVALLRAAGRVVGKHDTCRLAKFVPAKSCPQVAVFLESVGGWPPPVEAEDAVQAPVVADNDEGPVLPAPPVVTASTPRSSQDEAVPLASPFYPCRHFGPCDSRRCRCVRAGISCEKYCGCCNVRWAPVGPSFEDVPEGRLPTYAAGSVPVSVTSMCPNRVSCTCEHPSRCATDACPCFKVDRECDPDACTSCGAHHHPSSGVDNAGTARPLNASVAGCVVKKQLWRRAPHPSPAADGLLPRRREDDGVAMRRCRNVQAQLGLRARLVLGRSAAHGLGVFVAQAASRGDFVGEYVGELVTTATGHSRGVIYDAQHVSYLYAASEAVIIDATHIGSRTKFINHSSLSPNVEPRLLSIGGDIRVAFFAARPLAVGEELFFNYGYELPSWKP